jgi:hypothetical protein
MFFGESLRDFAFVLVDAADQIVGHADVQRASESARNDVNPIVAFSAHMSGRDYWIAHLRGR